MAKTKRSDAWDRSASLIAAIVNSRMGLKSHQTVTPEECHPIRRGERRLLRGFEAHAALDAAFCV